ncbi:MAG: N-acetylneuraminate synthase family protein [Treponema sp.]|nr:N-acetylneuraminate synthase family protein [Treponema sp.]
MEIIAEIGTSHGGSFDKAKELIDAAADAGATAVKFQWVYADEILHPDTGFVTLPGGAIPLYERFKQLEVTPEFFVDCRDYARKRGTAFICSPFGTRSLKELASLAPDAIKVASPELNHIPMLRALSELRAGQEKKGESPVPVIISSGVSTLRDIETALSILGRNGITLLHCITSYPAPEREYNLRLLETLAAVFGVKTGVSDHSLDPVLVPSLASAMGGTMIEKHITLSKKTDGLDDPVALEPEQFAHMCYCLRQCEAVLRRYGAQEGKAVIIRQLAEQEQYGPELVQAAIGDGVKKLAPSEQANYGRTNRSLHYMHALKKGHVITENDVAVLRTEKVLTPGIRPEALETVIGARLFRDVSSGDGVQWDDLTERATR